MKSSVRTIKINNDWIDVHYNNGSYLARTHGGGERIDIGVSDIRRAFPEVSRTSLYREGFHYPDSEHSDRGVWTTDQTKCIDDVWYENKSDLSDLQLKLKEVYDKVNSDNFGILPSELIFSNLEHQSCKRVDIDSLLHNTLDSKDTASLLSVLLIDLTKKNISISEVMKESYKLLDTIKSRNYYFDYDGILRYRGDKK